MKTVSVPTDWLNEIDGRSVADAIAYLSTLPSDHMLNYWQSNGDDHGVEISSELTYDRPYTEQELAEFAAQRKAKKIKDTEGSIAYYEKEAAFWESRGDTALATPYRQEAERFRQRLKELT
jgi:hypothetical protein